MNRATYASIVGRVLRAQRELRGIPLKDMAERLGFQSVSGWSRTETGDTEVTVTLLREAAIALGMTPSAVLALADEHERQLGGQG